MDYQKTLTKRLRPLFVAAFLQSFVFWYAIEKPFLNHLGLDKEAMALVSTVFSISYLITNVPSGILADRWSRRGVLILGSLCLGLACFIAGNSHGILTYAVSMVIFATYIASTQGTYDSIVYDTVLEETNNDTSYTHHYGRLRLVQGIGFAISSLCGGIIGHFISLRGAYFFSIPAAGLAIVTLLAFDEPRLHKKVEPQALGTHIGQTVRAILHKGSIAQIVICLVFATACSFIMNQLDQIWMLALALPIIFYGPVNALLLASTGVSGILADRATKSRLGPALVVIVLIMASLLLLIHKLPLVIIGQVLFLGSVTILQIILSRSLHQVAASHVRSGVSSLVTTIGTLLFIPLALFFGYISDRYGVFNAAWLVVAIVLLLGLSSIPVLYKQSVSN